MAYNPYYTGGWQSGEEGGTPITPDALNHMETGIEDAHIAIEQSTAYESSYNAGFLRGAVEHYGLTITNHAAFLVVVVDDSETNVYVGIFMFKYGTEIFKVDLANKGINYQAGNAQGTIAFTGITGTAKYTATRIG